MIPEGTCMNSINKVIYFYCVKLISILSQSFFVSKSGVIIAHIYVPTPRMIPEGTCTISLKRFVWFYYVKSISICRKYFFHGLSRSTYFPSIGITTYCSLEVSILTHNWMELCGPMIVYILTRQYIELHIKKIKVPT